MKTKILLPLVAILVVSAFVLVANHQTAFALSQATIPTATPAGGYYTSPVDVVLTSPDNNFFLYTTDGTTPNPSSWQNHNGESIRIESNTTLKAVTVGGVGVLNSEVMTETYVFPAFIYRFWSQAKQGHFYTSSFEERNNIWNNDPSWSYEGIAYNAFLTQEPGTMPIYRFWSASKQHHFFTISEAEKDYIIANDHSWGYEGIAYYAYVSSQPILPLSMDRQPQIVQQYLSVYRFWSDAKQGHFFTTSAAEKDSIIANDPSWNYEGIAWYVPDNTVNIQ